MRTILSQLHVGHPLKCEAWSNIRSAQGVQLTIYANGYSSNVDLCAHRLYSMIERSLTANGGIKNLAPCFRDDGHIYGAYTCGGAVHGLHKKILVYFADSSGSIDHSIENYFSNSNATIIPIVDTSLPGNPGQYLPASFNTSIAERVQNFDPSTIVQRILLAAGIINDGFRLFISYKHDDAAAIAGQLFHKLSERMFDVFLDRFSSRTGDDFVSLVKEELFDKACVLVLETDRVGQSAYCRQEVATAVAYNLGLLAVDLPGSQNTFPAIFRRHDLSSALLVAGQLTPPDLDSLVNFIEQSYIHEVARRSRAQDSNLVSAIVAAGLRPQPVGIGQYRVSGRSSDYVLTMCSRPPGITDFIETENLANGQPPAKGAIFGPITVIRTLRASQISWLGKKSDIAAIDEGHVMRTLNSISLSQPI